MSLYLVESRARYDYRCASCAKVIGKGSAYFRDEPHPMARMNRGAKVRHLCLPCVNGEEAGGLAAIRSDGPGQLILPFDNAEARAEVLLQAVIIPGDKTKEG